MRFCKNQRPGLQERVEKTEKLWFVHKGVYFESLVCAEVPTSTLMDSVRSKGIIYTRLRQTNVDQECNRQSKWRNYTVRLISEWVLLLSKYSFVLFVLRGRHIWISINEMEQHWPRYCYLVFFFWLGFSFYFLGMFSETPLFCYYCWSSEQKPKHEVLLSSGSSCLHCPTLNWWMDAEQSQLVIFWYL